MANPSSLSLCFMLLIFTCACSSASQFNKCQLDSINALEPDNRIESEAGVTETWNSNHPELRCAGVAIIRRTINSHGLHLPSYVPYPQLHFIVQGRGVLGVAIPGCPETYEEPQRQGPGQLQDRHQKVRYLKQGHIVAIPTGIPYWTYNYGNTPLVVITLLDTTNLENQLDQIPRRFYLAGNPKEEHPETREKSRRGQQEEEGNYNVFSGFDPKFLAEVLNANEDLAKKIQCLHGQEDQIIELKRGLSIIIPPLEREEGEEEEEHEHGRKREEEEEQQPRTRERREWRRERRRKEGEGGKEEIVEKKETKTRERKEGGEGEGEGEKVVEKKETRRTREPSERGRRRRQGQGEEEEEEGEGEDQYERGREEHHEWRRHGEKEGNTVQEDVCTLKLHENIANPSRADFFNPTAGRISTVNSLTLPLLKWLQLSAEWVNLYKNAIYAPHWNINANSVIYVTRGQGWVQVVDCQGKSVFNGIVRKGQVLVVPQNFVLAKKAGSEGLEYIAFKTKDRAIIGTLVGRTSAISAIPAEVLQNAMGLSPQEVSVLKNNRNEGVLVSPASHSHDSYITMV